MLKSIESQVLSESRSQVLGQSGTLLVPLKSKSQILMKSNNQIKGIVTQHDHIPLKIKAKSHEKVTEKTVEPGTDFLKTRIMTHKEIYKFKDIIDDDISKLTKLRQRIIA